MGDILSYFSQITGLKKEKMCMKCQSLFSGKNKKKYFKMLPTEMFTQHAMHELMLLLP